MRSRSPSPSRSVNVGVLKEPTVTLSRGLAVPVRSVKPGLADVPVFLEIMNGAAPTSNDKVRVAVTVKVGQCCFNGGCTGVIHQADVDKGTFSSLVHSSKN